MDVEELVVLSIAIFIVLCFVLVESTEIFLVLLLLCLLASLELAGVFIPREAKRSFQESDLSVAHSFHIHRC